MRDSDSIRFLKSGRLASGFWHLMSFTAGGHWYGMSTDIGPR